jgi:hypothetical protein
MIGVHCADSAIHYLIAHIRSNHSKRMQGKKEGNGGLARGKNADDSFG